MTVSAKTQRTLEKASWIRRMFEEGAQLKAKHGAENVFDFSLGNPNLEPPGRFTVVLIDTAKASGLGHHAYMPNIGFASVRQSVADFLSNEQGMVVTANDIVMTCGAAGAINVILKAILDPGDEVITTPFSFIASIEVIRLLKLVPVLVDIDPLNFNIDPSLLEAAITKKTANDINSTDFISTFLHI